MIESRGIIHVEPHKGRIVVDVNPDLLRLYYWFISTKYWIKMNTPMHGAHITIFNEKFNKSVNWDKAMSYNKRVVEFNYDENIVEGGYTKGILMYYLRVYSEEINAMKKRIGIVDSPYYKGLHLTIANGKNGTAVPHWPEGVTIK